MSSAGVAAKMALKSRTAVSAGDLNIGQTAQAGLDQAAAPAPAAAAGAYNFGELVRASGTLPVVPATSSNAGRPAHRDKARAQIRLQYGFVSEKNVKKHTDRLGVRVEQVSMVGSIGVQLKELASNVKQKQANVEVMVATAASRSSMQPGSAGPAAQVYEPSALRPPDPATEATPAATLLNQEQTKRVCYKCYLLGGRTLQQCFFKTADGLTEGHTGQKQGRGKYCARFDRAYPIGVDDEATQQRREVKIEEAKKKKKSALQMFTRQRAKVAGGNK